MVAERGERSKERRRAQYAVAGRVVCLERWKAVAGQAITTSEMSQESLG